MKSLKILTLAFAMFDTFSLASCHQPKKEAKVELHSVSVKVVINLTPCDWS